MCVLLPVLQVDCCGVTNVSDWLSANISFAGGVNFPATCCMSTAPTCNNGTLDVTNTRAAGCRTAVVDFLSNQLVIVAAIGIAFILGEVREIVAGVAGS